MTSGVMGGCGRRATTCDHVDAELAIGMANELLTDWNVDWVSANAESGTSFAHTLSKRRSSHMSSTRSMVYRAAPAG